MKVFPDAAVENRSKTGNCEHGKALVIDPAFEISGQLEGTDAPFTAAVTAHPTGDGEATGHSGSSDFPIISAIRV